MCNNLNVDQYIPRVSYSQPLSGKLRKASSHLQNHFVDIFMTIA